MCGVGGGDQAFRKALQPGKGHPALLARLGRVRKRALPGLGRGRFSALNHLWDAWWEGRGQVAGPAPPQVTWLLSKTALDSGRKRRREELPVINRRRPIPALPFLSPTRGADGCSEASALWEGKPAKQAEFPEKAGGPGTWPLVPRSRAFSGLQEVTSLSLCTGNMCVSVSLCPQAGPPDLWRH